MRKDYTTINLVTGYNLIPFNDGDLPFTTSFYGVSTLNVYKNDELVEPKYAGATQYTLEVADKDVLKFFFTKTPAKFNATITVDGEAENLTVMKDQLKKVVDFTSPIPCLDGSEFVFSVAEKSFVKSLTVNGTPVEPQEDKTYKVVVTAEHQGGTGRGFRHQRRDRGSS